MSLGPGPIRRLWFRWKMMKLPWRKQWLVGFDLQGNTFWEFKDALNSNRFRRIVKYSGWVHHGDVNVPPQWMQWLRHTRFDPPSITEQQSDILRQQRIKLLAAEADKRWAEKPSVLDKPDMQQPVQMLESKEPNASVGQMNVEEQARREPTVQEKMKEAEPKDSPWNKQPARTNPGEDWQPESWAPKPARRRGS